MTGDSERTAGAIAARVGVDEYYSEVLPEDKARFVEKEKGGREKGDHDRRRNQRFPGAVCRGRGHRDQ